MTTGHSPIALKAASTAAVAFTLLAAQAPAPAPAPESRRLEGNWQGVLNAGAIELRLVFRVTEPEPGVFAATFQSVDQGATRIPVDSIAWDEKAATALFSLKKIGASYEATLDADGTRLDGHWKQGGAKLPLVMNRTEKVAELSRPQTPRRPYPYDEAPVEVKNEAAGITLAGTLTIPRGQGPFPAAVLISGSGAQDRDESILGHKPFLVLADQLTRRGVAVLRVDDRGVGGSTGKTATSTSEDFGGDVLAEVALLKSRPEIDPARIGLIGHSEGGVVAPLVAARSPDIAFIVLMAGTGLPGDEIIMRQQELHLRAAGASDRTIQSAQDVERRILDVVKSSRDSEDAAARIRALAKEAVAQLSDRERQLAEEQKSGLFDESQLQAAASPWFRFFVSYDPRPTLAKVKCPVLALVGEKDLQVPARENVEAIAKALREGGNTHYEVHELPGLNHLFQTCETGSVSEYSKIEETIAPVALETIGDWVLDQVRRP